MSLHVSGVRFTPAPDRLQRSGLIGWASFLVADAVRVEVAVRRTAQGRLALTYPLREDCVGRTHYSARPIDDRARLAIEVQVFDALARDGRLAS